MPAPGASSPGSPSYALGTAQNPSGSEPRAGASGTAVSSPPPIISGPLAEQSQDLTRYLEHHRLPLVRAEVRRDEYGNREVMLYGFVATPYGKSDAQAKARRVLGNPGLKVVNEVKIRPELLSLNRPLPAGSPWGSGQSTYPSGNQFGMPSGGLGPLGSLQSYQGQQLASQSGSSSSWLDYLLPVLGVGAIIGLGFIGGGMGGFYPGMGYPFFP